MNDVVERPTAAVSLPSSALSLRLEVADALRHGVLVQEVKKAVMKKDVHFGKIPGTPKDTLYKAGAEQLCMVFRIAPSFAVEDLSDGDVIRYRVTCTGTHQVTGLELGSALGEASGGEEKYKWRKPVCDQEFDETPPHLRREKWMKGWEDRPPYKQKQIRTEPADAANTILKMAVKRAHVAMVLAVLAASDIFGQDLEDMEANLRAQLAEDEARQQPQEEQQQGQQQPAWPDDELEKRFLSWRAHLAQGKTHDGLIAWAEARGSLTQAQRDKIRALKPLEVQGAQDVHPKDANEGAPTITYAQLADKVKAATTEDDVLLAQDLIRQLPDDQRADANRLCDERLTELAGS